MTNCIWCWAASRRSWVQSPEVPWIFSMITASIEHSINSLHHSKLIYPFVTVGVIKHQSIIIIFTKIEKVLIDTRALNNFVYLIDSPFIRSPASINFIDYFWFQHFWRLWGKLVAKSKITCRICDSKLRISMHI